MLDKLAIHGGRPVIDSTEARFRWPRITDEAEDAVIKQLHTSISIYDKSGVFAEFEKSFADYHKRQYGLLSNSGTSAIFSMYEGINLQPGDEVICPVYTFHATASPMIYTGAVPVFSDCNNDGNINLEEIKRKITPKTKAVIVTHMWGVPVKEIAKIKKLCQNKNLYLLEDCSHAHGATVAGKPVGSFGDAAAWSLQGQKIITGGEGGIMLTNNNKIFNRALLQGHYNKRPKTEIPSSEKEAKFYLTGLGLKLRAHPLAIALANQQFGHLDEFIRQKQSFAELFNEAFKQYPFFEIPQVIEGSQNSWYVYNLKFIHAKAFGVSRESFVEALHNEGLAEVDIPDSTGLINDTPLFTNPHIAMPRLYNKPLPEQGPFPNAKIFCNSIIKLPVWGFADEVNIVEAYIKGFIKVANYLSKNKTLS